MHCTGCVLIFKLDDKCLTQHTSIVSVDDDDRKKNEDKTKIAFLRLMAIDAGSPFASILMMRCDWIFVHSTQRVFITLLVDCG